MEKYCIWDTQMVGSSRRYFVSYSETGVEVEDDWGNQIGFWTFEEAESYIIDTL